MASKHSIPPFPADIDRNRFGDWLSGFTDGEGYFNLDIRRCVPTARFTLQLRADDRPILEMTQAYLMCGHIRVYDESGYRKDGIKHSPSCHYYCCDTYNLYSRVVTHFDQYPLRAKKRHDYEIWRRGIVLLWEHNQGRGKKHWSHEGKQHFRSLVLALKEQRLFNSQGVILSKCPAENPLFDWAKRFAD